MLPVKVNADCTIMDGKLKGVKGRVISFDYSLNKVKIEIDEITYVTTTHENIKQ